MPPVVRSPASVENLLAAVVLEDKDTLELWDQFYAVDDSFGKDQEAINKFYQTTKELLCPPNLLTKIKTYFRGMLYDKRAS